MTIQSACVALCGLLALTSLFGCDAVTTVAAVGIWDEEMRENQLRQQQLDATRMQQGIDRSGNPTTQPALVTYQLDNARFRMRDYGSGILYIYHDRMYFAAQDGGWLNIWRSSVQNAVYVDGWGSENWIHLHLRAAPEWGKAGELCVLSLSDGTERTVAPAIDRWARSQ